MKIRFDHTRQFVTKLTSLFAFCLVPFASFCQQDTTDVNEAKPKIELIARPLNDSILLRWAPNNSLLWEKANKTGYIIERVTLIRDGAILPKPERIILTPEPLLPSPLSQWETLVKRSKYAAIAAQSLYGETFEVKNAASYDIYSVVTKVRERDSRFSFALFSADQSPEVAKLSGLWFSDTKTLRNEKYVYRVYLANSTAIADTGFVFTGTSEYQPLPKPLDLRADFADRKVKLQWNHQYFEHIYTAYILERSDDGGKTFKSVTDEPIVNLTSPGKGNSELFYKNDSLPQNDKKYYYRVRGINSFGEISDPSDAVFGTGHTAVTFTPYFVGNNVINNQKVYLKWEFPKEKNAEIKGFKISRSANPKNNFKYVDDKIGAEQREFTDPKPAINNYYIVSAFNQYGDEVRSAPILIQLIDSIPPSAPMGIKGFIDTTGLVKLSWKRNTEEDIYGYRVFRANYVGEEYSQITIAPVTDTCFLDSISLKSLTNSIFYKIMAIDLRENHSSFSKPLEIKRPNRIAPESPVFTNITSSTEGVYLEWANSTSVNVKEHMLYRSIPRSNKWELIAAFNVADSITSYLDKTADSTDYCSYTMIAKNESNLESKPANPVKGKKIDNGIRAGVDKLTVDVNREKGHIKLSWKKPAAKIYRYIIYRSVGQSEITVYTSLPGDTDSFTDEKLHPNTLYQYFIRVMFTDGSQSAFCKKTIVNY